MSLPHLLQALADLPVSVALRESEFLFPWLETFHVVAIAIVFGSILVVDLRLLGIGAHRPGAKGLSAELLPLTWGAFGLAVVTGSLMFISKAPDYFANPWFLAKMTFLALAGLNMAVFHTTAYRRIAEWDLDSRAPRAARIAGALSIGLWTLVVLCGRWIAFSG